MARSFTSGDSITLGSDASIDDYTTKNIFAWVQSAPAAGNSGVQVSKLTGWGFFTTRALALEANNHLLLQQDFSTSDGAWVTANNTITQSVDTAVGVVYNRSAAGNTPTFYVNGATSSTTTSSVPIGSSVADAAGSLDLSSSVQDWVIGHLIYDDVAFTAADANRHKWWGMAPGGPSTVSVYHPMWTDHTTNKGTATADLSLTGTAVVSMPKVMRPGCG
jgi:hypothetical protein